MVLLTMTPSMVEGLGLRAASPSQPPRTVPDEPSLASPAVGNPISHGQIVDLWKALRDTGQAQYTLESLLRGARVYVAPPPPKVEPTDEYKALMARLRREEEERAYERMANRAAATMTQTSHGFAEVHRPTSAADLGDDDGVTYDEVHRQLMLMLNFMLSIAGVAATLWVVARWWSTPARLLLAMGGGILVGIAEVAVYSGYVWHLSEAKKKDGRFTEVKEVVRTWVLGNEEDVKMGSIEPKEPHKQTNLRRRKQETSL